MKPKKLSLRLCDTYKKYILQQNWVNGEARKRGEENLFGHLILPVKEQISEKYQRNEPHPHQNVGAIPSPIAHPEEQLPIIFVALVKLPAECDVSVLRQSKNYY